MADRNSDIADPALDELRRRARRRLVGAIVLALAAAIILPMLLESDPRSLGDDVAVQIPPVGEGKFVNRLTGKSGDVKASPKADADKGAKAESRTAPPGPEAKSQSAPQPVPQSAAEMPAAPAAPVTAPGTEPAPKKSVAEAEQRVLAPSPKSAPAVEPPPATKAAPTAAGTDPVPPPVAALPASAKAEGFVVQLAAFSDDKGANALANKLKKIGYAAYVEPAQTARGTLWRVRVGGYGSRAEAEAARVKLKDEGHSGIVAPAT